MSTYGEAEEVWAVLDHAAVAHNIEERKVPISGRQVHIIWTELWQYTEEQGGEDVARRMAEYFTKQHGGKTTILHRTMPAWTVVEP